MAMEVELGPRVQGLPYKIKGVSRETSPQKAVHVLDTDLRNYWSTGTNTKEWILLELDEPCLLSHIRIHNKSVLEWEVAAGLRYKPETFAKVRPRCEAPRRDMIYPMNYTPCRYVRISCLRGSPIALFFIQLIGISVPGLEPELQPIVDHLLPHIISHEQDSQDMHLQLLQDVANRLHVFLPQLEAELSNCSDAAEPTVRFLAMLAGPFYPILQIVTERESARQFGSGMDSEVPRNNQQSPAFTVSSNFEPRRLRYTSSFALPTSSSTVFRPDAVFMLLRRAYRESHLGAVCRMASRILHHLTHSTTPPEESTPCSEGMPSSFEEVSKDGKHNHRSLPDYSELFGEEFTIPYDDWDSSCTHILDIAAVEEGILHVLYACASQPSVCSKLVDNMCDFWSALPLIQALLPALRPVSAPPDIVDDTFSQWMQPYVQKALSKIVSTLSSPVYHQLLHACAGYLSSYSPSHAKAACVLIDLCSGVLSPWMPQVIAKIDLALELLEDLLGILRGGGCLLGRSRAALIYLVLALSGYMDDLLPEYKEVKHKLLFLVEMLEPFLEPAISALQSMMPFGDVSEIFIKNKQHSCAIALNVIRTAVIKHSVLPSLESEWRRGTVTPSVLLSVLDPHMQLPPGIDSREIPHREAEQESITGSSSSQVLCGGSSTKSVGQDGTDGTSDVSMKMDIPEDASLLFAPSELQSTTLEISYGKSSTKSHPSHPDADLEEKPTWKETIASDSGFSKYFNMQVDYAQLFDYEDCEAQASEFRRLAFDLHSHQNTNLETQNAAIDALLLSAECYINPFFMISFKETSKVFNKLTDPLVKLPQGVEITELRKFFSKNNCNLETVAYLERKRDKVFVQILLEAAEMDRNYEYKASDGEQCTYSTEDDFVVNLLESDIASIDAITLLRRNQALICKFLVRQLQSEQHSMHETLLQSLLFFLHSATKLFCSPERVIDIILSSAEYLNRLLTSMFHQHKEGNLQISRGEVYKVQRRWMLLQSLVNASSGAGRGMNSGKNVNGLWYGNLVPPLAWVHKIPTFSSSSFPLVRYVGWMALSRNAEQYLKERLFLASDLSQLTHLLSIFDDDLALIKGASSEHLGVKQDPQPLEHKFSCQHNRDGMFPVIYPDVSMFFPNMQKEFRAFGEHILEAVRLQLQSFPSTAVPELLCWFSDLCLSPPLEKLDKLSTHDGSHVFHGYHARNAKAIILYVLEAIIVEHMEAIVPEMPRVVQVLESMCRSSYCDVPFLSSVLGLLKPIISHSLRKVSDEEKLMNDDSCLNFESLCFSEFFAYIRQKNEMQSFPTKSVNIALVIFILSSLFLDLSFQHKRELLWSSVEWVHFPSSEPTSSFYNYLCAFQQLLGSCKYLLVENLRIFGVIPMSNLPHLGHHSLGRETDSHSWFPDTFCYVSPVKLPEAENEEGIDSMSEKQAYCLSPEEIKDLSADLENLIFKLSLSIENCWKLHNQLSKNLAVSSAQCFMYCRCLSSIATEFCGVSASELENIRMCQTVDQFLTYWKIGLESLARNVLGVLENNCWEVGSSMLDCLFEVPSLCSLDDLIGIVCSAIKHVMHKAPKLAWRLQTDRWLSNLFARGISTDESGNALVELLSEMLSNPEPEQRFIALQNFSRLLGLDVNSGDIAFTSMSFDKLVSYDKVISVPDTVVSRLVLNTWDQVAVMASSDASLHLRVVAMALLVYYLPFADHQKLQSFLVTADMIFQDVERSTYQIGQGLLAKLSLILICGSCLYSPAEDVSLLPANVWRHIETIAMSKTGRLGDVEKRICQALCRVRNEGDDAKEVLREVLSSCSTEHFDSNFSNTRESVLQVLANLSSVQSYFDMFDEKVDQEVKELEEAELEMDILQKEDRQQDLSQHFAEESQLPFPSCISHAKDANRLQQIKDAIRSLERSRLREEIIARRQKKLLLRRARQKYLEEAALREAELLQELDRQRTSEVEREIERQRLLELEHAKTNELRYNLDFEKEKQTQRELQRELEQVESGNRSSRREFSSTTYSSRQRDRYRERDNGRSSADGSLRTSSASLQTDVATNNSSLGATPTVVLSGSRQFSGQLPTILQPSDRSADQSGSSYEENFDGSKDSGDTGSTGDPDFDGQSTVGFTSSQRHGSRGAKSRQIGERRERDGRREGKWERKYS
ncbi:hypothetical protein Ancab_029030 [Ancistrocladus abbreviatus]